MTADDRREAAWKAADEAFRESWPLDSSVSGTAVALPAALRAYEASLAAADAQQSGAVEAELTEAVKQLRRIYNDDGSAEECLATIEARLSDVRKQSDPRQDTVRVPVELLNAVREFREAAERAFHKCVYTDICADDSITPHCQQTLAELDRQLTAADARAAAARRAGAGAAVPDCLRRPGPGP